MPNTTRKTRAVTRVHEPGGAEPRLRREDPDEATWRARWAEADAHNRAELRRFRADLDAARRGNRTARRTKVKAPDLVEAPPLPDFGARRPAHVKRELLGRYLFDRDTGTVHDCYAAVGACAIDEIANGTFVHFGGELDAALPADAVQCPACMAEEA